MTSIGGRDRWDEQYPGHRYHYAMSRLVMAARAGGVRAIDGPVADYRDLEGFRQSCLLARGLGYDGKWCIHPSQIQIANEVFSPTEEEIDWATRVLETYNQAVREGRGAISLDGRMIDGASIRLAEMTLAGADGGTQRGTQHGT
jgi:citrate lyase subunit beta/citryl-CoA lyase